MDFAVLFVIVLVVTRQPADGCSTVGTADCGAAATCIDGSCVCNDNSKEWCTVGGVVVGCTTKFNTSYVSDNPQCWSCTQPDTCLSYTQQCMDACTACAEAESIVVDGVCVSTRTDNEHCGSFGSSCGDAATCVGGTCVCSDNSYEWCTITNSHLTIGCTVKPDTSTDDGSDGCWACRAEQGCLAYQYVCHDNTCTPCSTADEIVVDGVCTSTLTDQNNCGAVGNTCVGDCVGGVCQPACGDGVVDSGEECDDGNAIGGDGCSSACYTEYCSANGDCMEYQCGKGSSWLMRQEATQGIIDGSALVSGTQIELQTTTNKIDYPVVVPRTGAWSIFIMASGGGSVDLLWDGVSLTDSCSFSFATGWSRRSWSCVNNNDVLKNLEGNTKHVLTIRPKTFSMKIANWMLYSGTKGDTEWSANWADQPVTSADCSSCSLSYTWANKWGLKRDLDSGDTLLATQSENDYAWYLGKLSDSWKCSDKCLWEAPTSIAWMWFATSHSRARECYCFKPAAEGSTTWTWNSNVKTGRNPDRSSCGSTVAVALASSDVATSQQTHSAHEYGSGKQGFPWPAVLGFVVGVACVGAVFAVVSVLRMQREEQPMCERSRVGINWDAEIHLSMGL